MTVEALTLLQERYWLEKESVERWERSLFVELVSELGYF